MNILNIIDEISTEFNGTIPAGNMLLSILIASISAVIIIMVYKRTYMGVSYTKSFSLSIVLLALVTSIVIRTINSNLSLSLGMVGALSIVRFRTAVKDPIDTIFMFWAITTGIMSGAGLYLITIITTIMLGIIYFAFYSIEVKKNNKKLVVIKTNVNSSSLIKEKISKKRALLKVELYNKNMVELTYEISSDTLIDSIISNKERLGIDTINVIDIN